MTLEENVKVLCNNVNSMTKRNEFVFIEELQKTKNGITTKYEKGKIFHNP